MTRAPWLSAFVLALVLGAPVASFAGAVVAGAEGGGGDAGNDATNARTLAVGVLGSTRGTVTFQGRVGGADPADWYKLQLAPGDKIVVEASQERRASATVRPPGSLTDPELPEVDVQTMLPRLDLRLHEPRAAGLVVWSAPPVTTPARVELNVNESGFWFVSLRADVVANYTMRVSVSPVAFVPSSSAVGACGSSGSPLLAGVTAGSLQGEERSAFYRFEAAIGDDILVELLLPDPEGADIDLYLYNDSCYQLASSENGKFRFFPGDVPKGTPDAVTRLPALETGTYHVEARRVIGEGSFLLARQAFTPLPTLQDNDAGTGVDASDDQSAPTPLATAGVWQGRFEDGDPRDVYSFPARAGERFVVTFSPAYANIASISLLGAAVDQEVRPAGPSAVLVAHQTGFSQKVTIVLVPFVGGGNYVLSVASL